MMVSRVKKIKIIIKMPNSTRKKENKEKIKGEDKELLEESEETEEVEEIEETEEEEEKAEKE
jgi:hypothetical protein